jgi:hypothetical protein
MNKNRPILLIIFLLIIFCSTNLHAQMGFKLGVSLSGLLSTKADDYRQFLGYEVEWIQYGESKPVFGIQLGVFYTINISDYFDFQPEINFVQRGYWFDQTPLYDARYLVKIDYLEFPFFINYKTPIKFMNFHVSAGPFAAIKLNATGHLEYEGIKKIEPLKAVKDFDYGVGIALGSEFVIGTGKMLFDLRFNYGLFSMMQQPSEYINLYENPGKVKNLSITLTSGYRFSDGNNGG